MRCKWKIYTRLTQRNGNRWKLRGPCTRKAIVNGYCRQHAKEAMKLGRITKRLI
jgi:hypothetical protein